MSSPPLPVPRWSLGDRLRKAREHARLKQTELAQMTGIGRSSIVRYETDQAVPSRPVLLSWAMATGVSLAWLIDEEDSAADDPEFRKARFLTLPVAA
jgi:transcriptional regulator with XRE-family HTH domain